MHAQLAMAYTAEPVPAPTQPKLRAGDYLCTYCWSDYGLTDAADAFYCRTCARRDRLVPKRPHEWNGCDVRCPSPPEGYLRCPDDVAATCPVCSALAGFIAGESARRKDDEASARELEYAMRYVDWLRREAQWWGQAQLAALRVWDEDGYAAGWTRLSQCSDDDAIALVKREFRRLPLTYGQQLAGELAPEPTP